MFKGCLSQASLREQTSFDLFFRDGRTWFDEDEEVGLERTREHSFSGTKSAIGDILSIDFGAR
jgi:hypothetical protein